MSALEQEIIDKFRQLAPEDRIRLLSTLQEEAQSGQMSILDWLAEADAVRITLRPDSSGHVPSASDLVNEAREERDADILRSLRFGNSAGDRTS
jgi:hypothetical protein